MLDFLEQLYVWTEWPIRLAMLVYVPQRRSPAAARTWLLLIFLLPWAGLILYVLVGRIRYSRRRREVLELFRQRQCEAQKRLPAGLAVAPGEPTPLASAAANLAEQLGGFQMLQGNAVEVLTDYQGTLDRLVADMDAATQHIHLLTYIFGDDEPGRRVADALGRAAARGVQCRVLLDGFGSKLALKRMAPALRVQGIEVVALQEFHVFRRERTRADLRNHRKIAVCDGRIGYIGSQNITRPDFVPGHPNEEIVLRVAGPVVMQLQAIFLVDRRMETGDAIMAGEHFQALEPVGPVCAQALPSSPGYQVPSTETLMVWLIHQARRRVVVTTPYFVPETDFVEALRTAALRGVETHIIVSQHANQPLTQLAQQSYYDQLLENGIQIHLYRPRFLHAKMLTVDDTLALVGSSNIDIRSFALNAEASLLLHDPALLAKLRAVDDRHLADSDLLTREEWAKRPFMRRVAQNVARLADSFL